MIGMFTIIGWLSGNLLMASIIPQKIPMAPSTAFFFIIFGIVQLIILSPRRARKTRLAVIITTMSILCYSLIIFLESLTIGTRNLEDLIFGNFGQFQNVPNGRMAPITAILFILQSISLLCRRISSTSRRSWWNFSSSFATVVFVTAFTMVLGYLHNTPLLYGGLVIPMALSTAIAFTLQSASLLSLCGSRSFPQRIFTGNSAYARILRAFLPVSITTFLLHDLVFMYLHTHFNINFAILSAFSALGFASILCLTTIQVSRFVGNRIDRAEHARKELAQLKSYFLNNMSHELRTPLNSILGFTDLLLKNHPLSTQQEHLNVIQSSAEHLLTIVNNILSFSHLDSDVKAVLQSVPFSPHEVIERAIKSVFKSKKASVVLNIKIDETFSNKVIGDGERFGQLVSQLVENAFKFTDQGEVSIRVDRKESLPGEVRIRFEVSDTGQGIPEEIRPSLFKPFFQADGSLTRQSGGVGIGLALSQRLAEAFGGKIEFESREGIGSTFWCTLTFAAYEIPINSQEQKFEWHPKVLVVEDDESNQILAKHLLQTLGCRVDLADHGMQALQQMTQVHYDLILMDCQMPIMDGFQTTHEIRVQEAHTGTQVPIVACTAHAHGEAREKCFAVGMNGFISKPLNSAILKQTLESWFKYKKTG